MPTATPQPNKQSGFSLIEVMVAIIILAIVIIPLLRIQINLYRRQLRIHHTNTATLLAQSNMEKVLNILQPAARGGGSEYKNWKDVPISNDGSNCNDNLEAKLEQADGPHKFVTNNADLFANGCLFHYTTSPGIEIDIDNDNQSYRNWVELSHVCRDDNNLEVNESRSRDYPNCGTGHSSDWRSIKINSFVEWDEPGVTDPIQVNIQSMVIDLDMPL